MAMRNLSSLFAFVLLMAVAPSPARACTSDAECDDSNVCDGAEYCQAGICYNRAPLVCDDADPCTVNSCDPQLGCQYKPSANGCMLGGLKLKLGIRDTHRILLQTGSTLVSGAFPQAGGPNDPVLHGASIRLFSTVSGTEFDGTYGMPSSHWTYIGDLSGKYAYQYKDLVGANGPIRIAIFRNGKASKLQGSGDAFNFILHANPQPVQIVLRFGGLNDCLAFGAAKFKFETDTALRALHAPPPATCP